MPIGLFSLGCVSHAAPVSVLCVRRQSPHVRRSSAAYQIATAQAGFVRNYCLEHGVLIGVGGNFGNVLRLQPPLVISDAELDIVFATVAEALEAARRPVAV